MGPLSDVVVVDLSRALAGPHATMMLGDLGARVIKVEAPGRGDDTRGWGPPFVGEAGRRESTYFLSANRNKESITLDLKNDGRPRGPAGAWSTGPTCSWRTSAPACSSASASASTSLTQRNPRLVVLSITGFGHDGPEGGRAGYDQIAQGEAGLMSLTGSGPDDPQRVGRADRRPARRDVRRVRRRRRPQRAGPHRSRAAWSAPRCWPPSSGVHAFQGTRWTVAGEVGAGRRATTTRRSPLRTVPLPRRLGADRRRERGTVADGCAGFGSTREPRGWRPTPSGCRTATGSSRSSRRPSPTGTPRRCWRGWPRSACPAGKVRSPRRGVRVGPDREPGPADRRQARRPWARSRCPGRRCASSTPTGPRSPAVTTRHRRPWTRTAMLIRAWLGTADGSAAWTAHELLDLVLDRGSYRVLGRADRHR